MLKRDILYEIYNNLLIEEQARILIEQAYEDCHVGKTAISAREYASMSFDELTALTFHGPYFTDDPDTI